MGLTFANEQRDIRKFVEGLLDRIRLLEDRIRQMEANEDSNFNVVSNQSISGTATATDVLNRTVKGGTLGNDGTVGFRLVVVVRNNTGVAQNVTLSATFGGVTVFSRTESIGASASNRAILEVQVEISNALVTTAQRYVGRYENTPVAAADTLTAFTNQLKLWGTILTLDTEDDQDLIVTVQNGTANANMTSGITASYYIKPLPLTTS